MPNSSVFETACEAIEQTTSFDRLEARGTLRLALKSSGLDARDVTLDQMQAVIQRVLPAELESRGVADAASVCDRVRRVLAVQEVRQSTTQSDSPENIFARLGAS